MATVNSNISVMATREQRMRYDEARGNIQRQNMPNAVKLLFKNFLKEGSRFSVDWTDKELREGLIERPHAESMTLFAKLIKKKHPEIASKLFWNASAFGDKNATREYQTLDTVLKEGEGFMLLAKAGKMLENKNE